MIIHHLAPSFLLVWTTLMLKGADVVSADKVRLYSLASCAALLLLLLLVIGGHSCLNSAHTAH